MTQSLRVALFTDSFDEANGVATLSREFAAYAERRGIPFLCVHGGTHNESVTRGPVTRIQLKRSAAALRLDYDLRCDLLLSRHKKRVTEQLRSFGADLVHITGPGDLGVLGFWAAHSLKVPLVASWHTNLQEYMGRRLARRFSYLPGGCAKRIARTGEDLSLRALLRFYRLPRFLMAPNESMVEMLRERIGKPSYLMRHGVDTEKFLPCEHRSCADVFRIGYVGRLTPEKNVRMFAELDRLLHAAGKHDFRMLLIGAGSQAEWLKKNIKSAELPGILRGKALAAAFSNMDVFVFPSHTDTFGLVLLEAMASGVPVIVSPETGAHVGVQHGLTGYLAQDAAAAAQCIVQLMNDDARRCEMSREARRFACSQSWSAVFDEVYRAYETGLEECGLAQRCSSTLV